MINPVWQKNLECIKQVLPDLALALDSVQIPTQQVRIERAKEGSPVLCISNNHQLIPLNDMNNPVQSARDWVLHLGKHCLQNGHIMLVGVGTGYHPLALLKQSDQDTLIWINEPELQILKTALHILDYRPLFQSSRIRWLVGMNPQEITERLFTGTDSNKMRAQGIQLAVHQPVSSLYQPYIQDLSQAVSQAIGFDTLKFQTEEVQGKALLNNAIDNLPYILKGHRLIDLQSTFPGVPAWIIAPGPSLELELEQIKKHHHHAIIIAIDTANRILHKQDIHADIVVSIDFTELNTKHFDDIENDPALLAAFVGIQPAISKLYVGNTFFYIHSANRLIQSIPSLNPLGQLEAVGSTAHASYLLARMMGCSPIVFIGNDLSFPDEKWYANGAMQLELDQEKRKSEPLLTVLSNNGGKVKTNALYKIYLDEMGKIIYQTKGNVINTSMNGAVIPHTTVKSFTTIIHKYCSNTIDKSSLEKYKSSPKSVNTDTVLQDMQELSSHCQTVAEIMREYKEKSSKLSAIPRKFHLGVKEIMKSLQYSIQEHAKIYSLTIPMCTRSTINLFGNLGQAGVSGSDSVDRNKQTKENLIQLFDDFINALDYTNKEIQRGIRLIAEK